MADGKYHVLRDVEETDYGHSCRGPSCQKPLFLSLLKALAKCACILETDMLGQGRVLSH